MLKIDEWSFYEGRSEVDGNVVMRFYGQVDRNDADNILITEKEESEDSYRNNVDVIRKERQEFQDKVYFEASRIRGLNAMVDIMEGSEEETAPDVDNSPGDQNCVQISDNLNTQEGGVFNEV